MHIDSDAEPNKVNIPACESSPAMLRILGVLENKSNMSVSDISAEAFVGVSTLACGGYINALRKRQLIFVSGWRVRQQAQRLAKRLGARVRSQALSQIPLTLISADSVRGASNQAVRGPERLGRE